MISRGNRFLNRDKKRNIIIPEEFAHSQPTRPFRLTCALACNRIKPTNRLHIFSLSLSLSFALYCSLIDVSFEHLGVRLYEYSLIVHLESYIVSKIEESANMSDISSSM